MQDRGSLGDRFVSALSIKKTTSPVASSSTPSTSSVTGSTVTTKPVSSVKKSELNPAVESNADPSQVWR